MKLEGRNLEVLSITRQNLLDCDFVGCCDNCGRIIVNIAHVKDINTSEKFSIGLDCKKTLIDKKIIDKIMLSGDFMASYNVKEYKKDQNQISKFLLLCSQPEKYSIEFDRNEVQIYDKTKEVFEGSGIFGALVDFYPIGYLKKLGLENFVVELYKKLN